MITELRLRECYQVMPSEAISDEDWLILMLTVLAFPLITVKTLNIGTPRPATVVVLNIKQFNFTRQ